MALPSGTPANGVSVLTELAGAPESFDFHVALRRIECFFRDLPRLGVATRPADEPLRLGQEPSVAFAPSQLSAFIPGDGERPSRLMVAFFGLFGPNGALPIHLTEYARDRLRNAGDATFARFVDLFHHRMFLLFHRAWASAQPVAAEDRPRESRFRAYLGSLAGLGLPTQRGRDVIPEEAKWYYAGLLATANRSAEGLRSLLGDYFGVPVLVEEFVGEWVLLPENSRFRLGSSAETSALGMTTVIGARVRLCQHRFRIVMGPLLRQEFQALLPGGESLERLVAMVRTYAGDELSWDVRLVLSPDATDQLCLSKNGRLGWNTRLGGRGRISRMEDLIVNPTLDETRRSMSDRRFG